MSFALAIERNRAALLRIVAMLFAMLGFSETATVGLIPRDVHRAILQILRPAEMALRLLIAAAARGIAAKPKAPRPIAAGGIVRKGNGATGRPQFQLEDAPPRTKDRKHRSNGSVPAAPSPSPPKDDTVGGARLLRRLQAMMNALENLQREARRLVRSRVKREHASEQSHPIRPAPPSNVDERPGHEVEVILRDCHSLASIAPSLDTS